MKRLFALLGLLLPAVVASGADRGSVETVSIDRLTYAPLAAVARLAGGSLERHADPRLVTLAFADHRVEIKLDDPFVRIDGRMIELPRAVQLIEGEVLLPVESLTALSSSAFVKPLVWDGSARRIVLAPPASAAPIAPLPVAPILAPRSRSDARSARVLVLDPGHGGADAGVSDGTLVEKQLALALARRVAAQLERAGVHTLLTRDGDQSLSPEDRARLANRAGAAAVVSLHVGAYPSARALGATLWSPPAASAAAETGLLQPWREAAVAHAGAAGALADSLAAALDRAGLGPSHVRERLPLALIGVAAPGVMLEFGSLASPLGRARYASASGLDSLATAVASGIRAWGRW